jgi:hypothetical protein
MRPAVARETLWLDGIEWSPLATDKETSDSYQFSNDRFWRIVLKKSFFACD